MIKSRTRGWLNLLAALGAAGWIEKLVTLEWSYPYCSVLDDGEAAAVYGFPLPYEQIFIAGSASSNFIPWLYAVNLVVIAGGVFLLLNSLASRLGASRPRLWNITIGAAAAFLLVTAIAFDMFILSIDVWHPTSSFSANLQYSELRPVAVNFGGRPRNCTASPFWFPDRRARSTSRSMP
jgi:hypothetical protein